jgi:hypothetical protein
MQRGQSYWSGASGQTAPAKLMIQVDHSGSRFPISGPIVAAALSAYRDRPINKVY